VTAGGHDIEKLRVKTTNTWEAWMIVARPVFYAFGELTSFRAA
jgi:hypothetical protein